MNSKLIRNFFALIFILHGALTFAKNNTLEMISDPHLYIIEKNGVISYILGSIHFGVDLKEFPPYVLKTLETRPVFVTEVLKKEQKGIPVKDEFSTIASQSQALLKQRGMTREDFNRFRPETICSVYLYWDYLDKNSDNGEVLDNQLENYAKFKNKILKELDVNEKLTAKAAQEIFNSCNIEETLAKFPPSTVSSTIRETLQPGTDAYKFGGERYLQNGPNRPQSSFERNESWLPLLIEMHKQGFFAVVGAAHLDPFHQRGLLSLLRDQGFKVTRINKIK